MSPSFSPMYSLIELSDAGISSGKIGLVAEP